MRLATMIIFFVSFGFIALSGASFMFIDRYELMTQGSKAIAASLGFVLGGLGFIAAAIIALSSGHFTAKEVRLKVFAILNTCFAGLMLLIFIAGIGLAVKKRYDRQNLYKEYQAERDSKLGRTIRSLQDKSVIQVVKHGVYLVPMTEPEDEQMVITVADKTFIKVLIPESSSNANVNNFYYPHQKKSEAYLLQLVENQQYDAAKELLAFFVDTDCRQFVKFEDGYLDPEEIDFSNEGHRDAVLEALN